MYLFKLITALSLVTIWTTATADWVEIEPEEHSYQSQSESYQTQRFDILLPASNAMEFKLSMLADDTIVYEWNAEIDQPASLVSEFHGHTERVDDEPGTLVFYKKQQAEAERGSLTAPFTGNHGWYFENNSEQDVSISLSVAGWYSNPEEIFIEK